VNRANGYGQLVSEPLSAPPTAAAVVLAGGSGSRLGAAGNKVYLPLAGRRVISWALNAFASVAEVGRLVLVVRAEDRAIAAETLDREVRAGIELVDGGCDRHGSEYAALRHLAPAIESGEIDVVAIHDGARPLASRRLIAETITTARLYGAAIPGLDLDDAMRSAPEGLIPVPASRLVRVQTPQAFQAGPLLEMYERAAADRFSGTDTSACIERYGGLRVHCLPGDVRNIKITYPQDLFLAERLLALAGHELR
jgi:2-C-methyl-D-erythritol 4-phosphate cytidylyltransferase